MAETVVIPVTGAFNPSLRVFRPSWRGLRGAMLSPVGSAHYQRLTVKLETHGLTVETPIVLEHFGLLHPEDTRERVIKQMRRRLERNPHKRALAIGHSLGGCVVASILGEGIFEEQLTSGITLGSPHQGAENFLMFIARQARHLPTKAVIDEDNLDIFNQEANRLVRAAVEAGDIAMASVATPHDALVPWESALTDALAAQRHIIGDLADEHTELDGITAHHMAEAVDHIGLLTSVESARFCGQLAADMAGVKQRRKRAA